VGLGRNTNTFLAGQASRLDKGAGVRRTSLFSDTLCRGLLALTLAAIAPLLHSQSEPSAATANSTVLPDPVALLKAVQENQKHIEAIRKDYIFHRKDEERVKDTQGRAKSTHIREYEVFLEGPWEIERLLSKDGKPLTESEQKKQDEEVHKQQKKARERIAKEAAGADPGEDTITMGKFLAADRFYNLRNETYEGHRAFAIDFSPRPDFQPHGLTDKILKSVGGTLWIDPESKQAVHLEAHLLEGLKVLGGLVGSVDKGATVVLNQELVNGEIWMPSYTAVDLNARAFFLRRSWNVVSTYSDYRKFRVDTKLSGVAPAPSTTQP